MAWGNFAGWRHAPRASGDLATGETRRTGETPTSTLRSFRPFADAARGRSRRSASGRRTITRTGVGVEVGARDRLGVEASAAERRGCRPIPPGRWHPGTGSIRPCPLGGEPKSDARNPVRTRETGSVEPTPDAPLPDGRGRVGTRSRVRRRAAQAREAAPGEGYADRDPGPEHPRLPPKFVRHPPPVVTRQTHLSAGNRRFAGSDPPKPPGPRAVQRNDSPGTRVAAR